MTRPANTLDHQLWALVAQDGSAVLRITAHHSRKPRRGGCGREIRKGIRVHPLHRGLEPGESVAWERGGIVFTGVPPTVLGAIKAEAARRIEAIAPLWRQINDLRVPTPEGAARFAAIDAVRSWSDELEAEARQAPDRAELDRVRSRLREEPAQSGQPTIKPEASNAGR